MCPRKNAHPPAFIAFREQIEYGLVDLCATIYLISKGTAAGVLLSVINSQPGIIKHIFPTHLMIVWAHRVRNWCGAPVCRKISFLLTFPFGLVFNWYIMLYFSALPQFVGMCRCAHPRVNLGPGNCLAVYSEVVCHCVAFFLGLKESDWSKANQLALCW